MNSHYLKERPLSQLAEDVIPYISAKGYPVPQDKSWLEKMVKTLRERSKTLVELVDAAAFYLTDDISIDEKAATKFLTPEVRTPIEETNRTVSSAWMTSTKPTSNKHFPLY